MYDLRVSAQCQIQLCYEYRVRDLPGELNFAFFIIYLLSNQFYLVIHFISFSFSFSLSLSLFIYFFLREFEFRGSVYDDSL